MIFVMNLKDHSTQLVIIKNIIKICNNSNFNMIKNLYKQFLDVFGLMEICYFNTKYINFKHK